MRVGASKGAAKKSGRFRIAILGDFSARVNSGKLDTGDALAGRKPLKVDVDNFDAILKRMNVKLRLPIGAGSSTVEFPVASMDDLHPDQLFNNLPVFSELSGLRQRLKTQSTFAKAAKEVQAWAGVKVARPRTRRPRSAAIPADASLNDFARLIGEPTARSKSESAVADLLRNVVGPYVVPAKDPRQDELVATVDAALAATMRSVLHHPDFQSFESLWRSIDLLVRRLETNEQLQLVLYDVTAEEFAADLSKSDELENTGLYKLLVEQPSLDAGQGAFSVIIGNYQFEHTPPHAELLGRIAKIVAPSQTAFIAAMGPSSIDVKPADLHPLIQESWNALAEMPQASYVGLVTPRFLLRMPYGERTDPIDSFDFEEFTPQAGLAGMLWGNPAIIAGLLLGTTFSQQGAKMKPGTVLTVGEMPFYYYTDSDGDQVALPCTERMLSSRMAELVAKHRFMPLLSMKGRPEVRLAGFTSLADRQLAGPWQPVATSPDPEPADDTPPPAEEASDETTAETTAESSEEPAEDSTASSEESTDETPAESAASEGSGDSDLDALLASLGEDSESQPAESAPASGDDSEMDPELAKLLKEIG